MSVNYRAIAVVGARLSDMLRIAIESVPATRYDVGTGIAYQVTVTAVKCYWCGQEIPEPVGGVDDWIEQFAPGLSLYNSGESSRTYKYKSWHGYDLTQFVVSKELSNLDEGSVESVPRERLDEAYTNVKQLLESCGYNEAPQLHLFLRVD